mmetsp:Transcript_99140/g.256298  ORF Transcript_99140/g.256298 Transcript_99140/m.256298 type:complete len:189 (-) Transcript_99140:205-771(-)
MFQCKMCSENPFEQMFGEAKKQGKDRPGNSKKKDRDGKKPTKGTGLSSRRHARSWTPRSEDEVQQIVKRWMDFVHTRARDYFVSDAKLEEVLSEVAKGIDRNADPVLGSADHCVFWYSEVTGDDFQPAIKLIKPGETEESTTYVNRILAFIFATDESFEQLMKLPPDSFKMSCGDQLCVHLAHVALLD